MNIDDAAREWLGRDGRRGELEQIDTSGAHSKPAPRTYRFIYTVVDDELRILRVCGSGQTPLAPTGEPVKRKEAFCHYRAHGSENEPMSPAGSDNEEWRQRESNQPSSEAKCAGQKELTNTGFYLSGNRCPGLAQFDIS